MDYSAPKLRSAKGFACMGLPLISLYEAVCLYFTSNQNLCLSDSLPPLAYSPYLLR